MDAGSKLKIKNRKASPKGPRIEIKNEEPKQLRQANLKESVSNKPIYPYLSTSGALCSFPSLFPLLSGAISSTAVAPARLSMAGPRLDLHSRAAASGQVRRAVLGVLFPSPRVASRHPSDPV